jgi:endonuclease/exonuclease/phosphatase family metal-dependent hydrolase
MSDNKREEQGGQEEEREEGLRIMQQNVVKSLEAQLALLEAVVEGFEVVCIQEQYIDFREQSRAFMTWRSVYPQSGGDADHRQRAVTWIHTKLATDTWHTLQIDSPDIVGIIMNTSRGKTRIFNIYNNCMHSESIDMLKQYFRTREVREMEEEGVEDVWVGDFNRHHPMWDEARNSHLFMAANLDVAEELLEVAVERGMEMTLPKGLPTLEARATCNLTRPDNVFCSASLIEAIVKCDVHPEDCLPIADHFPIVTHLNTSIQQAVVETKKNFRAVDWKELVKLMTERLATITPPKELESLMEFKTAV